MRHPLTSKERRGLAAVAAAALLCIGAGVIVRSCRVGGGVETIEASGSRLHLSGEDADSVGKSRKKNKSGKKTRQKKTKTAKKKAPKAYPVRDPLSEPCD